MAPVPLRDPTSSISSSAWRTTPRTASGPDGRVQAAVNQCLAYSEPDLQGHAGHAAEDEGAAKCARRSTAPTAASIRRLLKKHGATQASRARLDGDVVPSADFTRLCEELDALKSEQLAWFEKYDLIVAREAGRRRFHRLRASDGPTAVARPHEPVQHDRLAGRQRGRHSTEAPGQRSASSCGAAVARRRGARRDGARREADRRLEDAADLAAARQCDDERRPNTPRPLRRRASAPRTRTSPPRSLRLARTAVAAARAARLSSCAPPRRRRSRPRKTTDHLMSATSSRAAGRGRCRRCSRGGVHRANRGQRLAERRGHEQLRARAEAKALDAPPAATRRPLHGVPMTIKDSLDTAGVISTGATYAAAIRAGEGRNWSRACAPPARFCSARPTRRSSRSAKRCGIGTASSLLYGSSHNPYDLTRSTRARPAAPRGWPRASPRSTSVGLGRLHPRPSHGWHRRHQPMRVPRTGHIVDFGGISTSGSSSAEARRVEIPLTTPIISGPGLPRRASRRCRGRSPRPSRWRSSRSFCHVGSWRATARLDHRRHEEDGASGRRMVRERSERHEDVPTKC